MQSGAGPATATPFSQAWGGTGCASRRDQPSRPGPRYAIMVGDMRPDRRPSRLASLMAPHASSPRRWLFVAVFLIIILTLGALGVLP